MEIKELLESEEFRKAVIKLIEQEIRGGIDADEINDLESKIEDVVTNGSFEITFSA